MFVVYIKGMLGHRKLQERPPTVGAQPLWTSDQHQHWCGTSTRTSLIGGARREDCIFVTIQTMRP